MEMARIFLIDDHPAVRQGLRVLLSQEAHTVCGEAGNIAETMARIDSSNADMALLDLSLGDESGLDLIAGLRQRGIAVLVYSICEESAVIEMALNRGANGYVSKRETTDILLAAVTDIRAGKRHLSPRATMGLANRILSNPALEHT
ncbi:MAG: response regulator transcription factor [Desulfuromonadales bacterium]|nr:response regulator transcription factor [Desulfuromonadales bacterium]